MFTLPLLKQLAQIALQQLATIFGDDISTADQTPQGQFAGIVALVETIIGEALVDVSLTLCQLITLWERNRTRFIACLALGDNERPAHV